MVNSQKYERFFILLKQESSGYNVRDKKISGNCTIEIKDGKGKLSTYIQGLKSPDLNKVYRVYLMAQDKQKVIGVPANLVYPDQRGKSESKWEFDPANVAGSGISYDRFEIFAVLLQGSDRQSGEIVAPLVGYKNDEVIWKHLFEEATRDKPTNNDFASDETRSQLTTSDSHEISPSEEKNKGVRRTLQDEFVLSESGDSAYNLEKIVKLKDFREEPAPVNNNNKTMHIPEFFPKDTSGNTSAMKKIMNIISENQLKCIESLLLELEKVLPPDLYTKTIHLLYELVELVPPNMLDTIIKLAIEIYTKPKNQDKGELLTKMLKVLLASVPSDFLTEFFEHTDQIFPYIKDIIFEEKHEEVPKPATEKQPVANNSSNNKQEMNRNFEPQVIEMVESEENTDEISSMQREYATAEDYFKLFETNLQRIKSLETEFKNTIQTVNMRFEELSSKEIFPKDIYEEIKKDINSLRYTSDEELEVLFNTNQEMAPFRESEVSKWIRISIDDVVTLPVGVWRYLNHPYIVSCYRKYNHFILGKAEENSNELIFGIPDLFLDEYENTKPLSEFTRFEPCISNEELPLIPGYWLLEL